MTTMNRDKVLDLFRGAILATLDETAREAFDLGIVTLPKKPGAADADLPELFRSIDRHAERLAERYGIVLVDRDGPQGVAPPIANPSATADSR